MFLLFQGGYFQVPAVSFRGLQLALIDVGKDKPLSNYTGCKMAMWDILAMHFSQSPFSLPLLEGVYLK